MTERIAAWMEARFGIVPERTRIFLYRAAVAAAALAFVIVATLIVVYDELSLVSRSTDTLRVGAVAPSGINAPQALTYTSQVLTDDARNVAAAAVQPVFDAPDPNITRQQTQLAQQILTYIRDIRKDVYGTLDQRIGDLSAINTLDLDDSIMRTILDFSDESWDAVTSEVINTLSLAMRESIRPSELTRVRAQLSNQVSVRFSDEEREVIVAIVEDMVRANSFLNDAATEQARSDAQAQVVPKTRSVVRGERIVGEGDLISPLAYETLNELGVLEPPVLNPLTIGSGLLLVLLVMTMIGLYLVHFNPLLVYRHVKMFILLASIFLVMLLSVRLFALGGNLVIFPYAALALLFVAIAGMHEAIAATLGLGILSAYMANTSLEVATLVIIGSIIGALSLRNTQRLNAFFISGSLVGVANIAIICVFRFGSPDSISQGDLLGTLALSAISSVVVLPATTIAGMFVVTQLFNLPTTLRLLDLSQPNKPMLQRMLREAAGTYQHSLQVANLAEQAAQRINADAQLVRVAALYHDIGKMENPLFFTENQPDPTLNPHIKLNDPYRSAAIIIEHVTKGDEMARAVGLPKRLRDFILEHHGTTKVGYFYRVALDKVNGDASLVDTSAFEYPGPRPQSRETGLLMLADSCEATVRSIQPKTRAEIERIVDDIFEIKRKEGQLNESGLTLTDLAETRAVFIEILQGMYHHRIKYQEDNTAAGTTPAVPAGNGNERTATNEAPVVRRTSEMTAARPPVQLPQSDDEQPVDEVPRLPRAEDRHPEKPPNAANPQEQIE